MKKIRIAFIIGTRPEVIKMAPVIKEAQNNRDKFESKVIITGQHRDMCKPYLDLFSIIPDYNLSIMEENQTLDSIVINILRTLPKLFAEIMPDVVLVQGDTTSAFAAALSAYHFKIKIGHVEAGLRTYNKYNPFPEEINRKLISSLADIHFAPTQQSKNNLINEGITPEHIHVTGNTVIDALKLIIQKDNRFSGSPLSKIDFDHKKIICVTTHRRESFGEPMRNTLSALKKIEELFPDIEIIFPVHYNPNVRQVVNELLGNSKRIHLIDPLPYEQFAQLLNRSYLVLTDSGGIQEEAPSLGKPVLVLRDTTERPEGVEAGTTKIVGTDQRRIIKEVKELLENKFSYEKMANAINPYGDGKAAIKILDILELS